jgi:hypothetical protein
VAYERNITKADNVHKGTDVDLDLIVHAADATDAEIEAGTADAQNITGWALSWVLKRKQSHSSAKVTKTTGSGITITTGSAGEATIELTDDDTDGLEHGLYYHELKRTDAGEESILIHGTFLLQRSLHGS